jgi:hypothetical protein
VTLMVDPSLPLFDALTVEHPGCNQRAPVSLDLDAYYCSTCRWSGRIGADEAVAIWEEGQSRANVEARRAALFSKEAERRG